MKNRLDNRPQFSGLKGSVPEEIFGTLPTPCYILDEGMLRRNGEILAGVAARTGCKILLAQKAFSNYDLYPVLEPYLAGTEASGLFEARLGAEEMPGKEVHVFCAAYRAEDMEEIHRYADHIVFNSPRQLAKFGAAAKAAGKSVGLRINPEFSTQEGHAIYDPCAPGSRLGTTRAQWDAQMTPDLIALLDGLHFHTLCEQNSDDLKVTLQAVEEKFGDVLLQMKWLNFGGGHHITRVDYELDILESCIRYAQEKWQVQVYLEPGEACALNAGYLATRVLDVVKNGDTSVAILDMSAACHTPDVIEMPYLPPLYDARTCEELEEEESSGTLLEGVDSSESETEARVSKKTERWSYICRLGGPTCLSGDIIGDYAFGEQLQENDLLLFGDMAIYSTCKNNTFNGMPLPPIYVIRENGELECLKRFSYVDFKMRLGR